MKKYIKNNNGVALPAVIVMMMVLTVLAAGLGTYALNSLERVMYMDTQKQAYYLARAGVETGAYAYQSATTKSSNASKVNSASSFNNVDSFVSILENSDEVIKSDNYVWLIPSSEPSENVGTEWQGLTFTATDSLNNPPPAAIGYFSIEMVRSYQDVIIDTETGETAPAECVEIRSTAVCFNDKNSPSSSETRTHVTRGYVFPTTTVDTGIYCDDDGYLIDDGDTKRTTDENNKTVYNGVFDYCSEQQAIDYSNPDMPIYSVTGAQGFISKFVALMKNVVNGIISAIFELVKPPADVFYVYGVYDEGDMIIGKPSSAVDTLKIMAGKMGFYVFSTSGNMTVDAGVDVETTDGKYATVAFYGNDIVINGDINMAVYYIKPSASSGILSQWTDAIKDTVNEVFSTFGNRYRLGTIVIGAGTSSGGQWYEYLDYNEGGITNQGGGENIENANRIFFNGNVSIRIYSQGGSTEVYRIFSDGDICLFNGSYILDKGEDADSNEDDVRGIDLLKYFIDAVVVQADGFNYGSSTANKLKEISDLYYGDVASYFDADGDGKLDSRPIRKLNVNYGTDNVTIDGLSVTKILDSGNSLADYLIQPTPTSVLNIYWGKPSDSGFDAAN